MKGIICQTKKNGRQFLSFCTPLMCVVFAFFLTVVSTLSLFVNSTSAITASYYATELRVGHANNSTTVFNSWTSSGRSVQWTNSSSPSTNYSINTVTVVNSTLAQGVTISPYQSLRITFDAHVVIGPDGFDTYPIFSCPNRVSNFVVQITSCNIEKSVTSNNYLPDNYNGGIQYLTGAMVYDVTYDIVVTYLRTTQSTSDLTVPLSGPFFSYVPAANRLVSITFSRPVMYLFEDPAYAQVAQNSKDDQDRSDIESQSSSTDSSASSSQNNVQSASGSIISHITSIVGALSTASSDCLIDIDTGNLQLQQINLCSAPNEIRTLINNIMTLIVTVSVLLCSYSLIRQFLSIYESFIAGGRS